jgi:hypothetical protein
MHSRYFLEGGKPLFSGPNEGVGDPNNGIGIEAFSTVYLVWEERL